MSNLIVLEDGGAWKAAGWAWAEAVRMIADEFGGEFGEWLAEFADQQRNGHRLDLRELAPRFRRDFHGSARRAYARALAGNGEGWSQPERFPGWRDHFGRLILMVEALDSGRPTDGLRDYPRLIPASGYQLGPGWDGVER